MNPSVELTFLRRGERIKNETCEMESVNREENEGAREASLRR